jgi:RNA polymerase sigma factor (sigma-70 family)
VDDAQFDTFYRGTWQRVVTFLYAVSGDLAEAQDVTQEAYARCWQRWSVVSGYGDPEAWVRTVGFRLYLNRWRKARNRLTAYRRHGVDQPISPPSEATVALVAALRKLSAAQRQAVVLHHLLDLPVDEVARQTGTSASNVKARLVKGRQVLGTLLADTTTSEVNRA